MTVDRTEKVEALERLYDETHEFAVSRDRGETPLTLRKVVPRSLDSHLVLLAQGLAQSTQRVTGYPYRKPDGLSPAGKRLDKYLIALGHTIDHSDESRIYAYSTDLVPWFPGKHQGGRGDLRPSPDEIRACWGWFEHECELVQPQAIVLLGGWAGKHFLRRFSHERLQGSLQQAAGQLFEAKVAGLQVLATLAYHPSAIWGRFEEPGSRSWESAVGALSSHLIR